MSWTKPTTSRPKSVSAMEKTPSLSESINLWLMCFTVICTLDLRFPLNLGKSNLKTLMILKTRPIQNLLKHEFILAIFPHVRLSLVKLALIVAFLPIALAFITSLLNGTSMFDEGSGSGGYLWLLMGSVPLGVAIFVIALVVKLAKRTK